MKKVKRIIMIISGMVLLASFNFCTSSDFGTPDETAADLNLLRSCMTIREINWAGSMSDAGVYDPDDDFIEFQNTDCGVPTDITGWKIIMRGQITRTFLVPAGDNNIIQPNALAVVVGKDGAFSNDSTISLPGMAFPYNRFSIETKTREDFLIENEMNSRDSDPLAGSYDGFTTRSMERTDDQFDQEGGSFTSWHTSTPCNGYQIYGDGWGTDCSDTSNADIGWASSKINYGYKKRTFATPGENNTSEYK